MTISGKFKVFLSNPVLFLVVGIPISSLLVGILMLTAAQRSNDTVANHQTMPDLAAELAPLSKTSWRSDTRDTAKASIPMPQSRPEEPTP